MVYSVLGLYILSYVGTGDRVGHPVPGACRYGHLALQAGGVSNSRQQNVVTSPAGVGPETDCAGEDQQQL
jgi:hypothetical protein